MSATDSHMPPPTTLKEFYELMEGTTPARRRLVETVLSHQAPALEDIAILKATLAALQAIPKQNNLRMLFLSEDKDARGKVLQLDLGYEIGELERDILYLEQGEEALLNFFRARHEEFDAYVTQGVKMLSGMECNCFISDRDGTVNNYCGRYRSSIQSVYNAVFLTRFARKHATNPVLLTSAPLKDIGIVDVSVNPPRTFVYAASKGRECLDLTDQRRVHPVPPDKQALLNTFNAKLEKLVAEAENEKFGLVGSGLQRKFGQTTVARQDISNAVPKEESEAFLRRVEELVHEVDPQGEQLRIEDTGLDIEIILTIEHASAGLKDFDKGDGVAYLDEALSLNMDQGPHLVCGDTNSDLPMLRVAMEHSDETRAIYVTRKQELRDKVLELCPHALLVPEPDMLVTILGTF